MAKGKLNETIIYLGLAEFRPVKPTDCYKEWKLIGFAYFINDLAHFRIVDGIDPSMSCQLMVFKFTSPGGNNGIIATDGLRWQSVRYHMGLELQHGYYELGPVPYRQLSVADLDDMRKVARRVGRSGMIGDDRL